MLEDIMAAVAKVCHVPRDMIRSRRRYQEYARARFVFCYCARNITSKSFSQIARACGGRDHSTIIHGVRRVVQDYPAFADHIAAVEQALGVAGQ